MSIAAGAALFVSENKATQSEIDNRASNVTSALQGGLNQYFAKVFALRALFQSSSHGVSRAEFQSYAEDILRDQPGILSVSWIPRVARGERAIYEQSAVADGISQYNIRSTGPDGQWRISPDKDEYFPVYYTTEKQSPYSVYGLDLNDGALRQEALAHARDGDRLVASGGLTLQSGVGDRRGFFVLLPVYRQGLPHDTEADRRGNLVGFIQGVFQTQSTVDAILGSIRVPLDFYIFGSDASPDSEPISVFTSGRAVQPRGAAAIEAIPHWSGQLQVADATWKVLGIRSADQPGAGHEASWILVIAGLLVTGVIAAFMLASGRHAAEVFDLAQRDVLTSLANHRAFLDRLEQSFVTAARGEKPFAVLYCDLDHFKDVNDTLGHPTGDELLQQVAARLLATVSDKDLVARFGGDEFAVLEANATDLAAAGALAAKLIDAIAGPYLVEGSEIHITVSIGISFYSRNTKTPASMMMQADLALYRAKNDGRNGFRFHSRDLDSEVQERVTLGEELRGAAVRGELELHYEPQVELNSGRIIGVEALLRWNHPLRGQLMPSLFIPIAERTGSVVTLGRWAFDRACQAMKSWQDESIAPNLLAVNFSAIQFKGQPDLEFEVMQSLAKWGIAPSRMEVELTESVLMEVAEKHCDVLTHLSDLGLRIAIDDFGTGYSSLSYLTQYPVSRLKIAQQLVSRVDVNRRNATVVRAAIHMARELGIEVIAEGVETKAHATFLTAAGCEFGQGYYYSQPLDEQGMTMLLRYGTVAPADFEVPQPLVAA